MLLVSHPSNETIFIGSESILDMSLFVFQVFDMRIVKEVFTTEYGS
jgi:hypothetical protein